jgi:hypothetical protein
MAITWNTMSNFRWCNRCQGLWLGTNQSESACPEGGTHSSSGSGNYSLVRNATPAPANHQAGWRWCSRCQGLWFGPNQSGSTCPEGGQHSSTGSGDYHLPTMTSRVRVHTKILVAPAIPLGTLFQNMREVYASCGIDVVWASDETLDLPALEIVDAGQCFAGQTTVEQNQLFQNRNFAAANDIVVYFVEATNPPYNGCAAHPAGRPGSVVVRNATQWTFAHEQGHVLGLAHVDDNNRLMTGNGTANITNPPPDLAADECATMQASTITTNL